MACNDGSGAIFDTGTTVIIGPSSAVTPFYESIVADPIAGQYTVNCEVVDQLPAIQFQFGGNKFELTGPEYIMPLVRIIIHTCVLPGVLKIIHIFIGNTQVNV